MDFSDTDFSLAFRLKFFRRLNIPALDDCWEWRLSSDEFGYGSVHVPGRGSDRAHRVGYEMANGPVPDGLLVRHSCDNPPCANPAHLELGTYADNNRDTHERGRARKPRAVCPYGHDQSVYRNSSKQCSECVRYDQREKYRMRTRPGYVSPPRKRVEAER